MSSTDLIVRLIEAMDFAGVPYMLVGSYSSNYYGRPRSTKDADFVLQVKGEQLATIAARLGPDFRLDQRMSFETVTMTTRHVIHHIASAFTMELFLLSDDAHDQARFARRRSVEFEGRKVWLPTPEDVIVTKLRWSKGGRRAKDIEDVRNVLSVQAGTLDMDYVRGWTDAHGTRQRLEQLLAETGKS